MSALRTKPKNLIRMVLEESKEAEQEEKLERENDDDENSGQEYGSSANFVQASGETVAYHEKEHPASKPQNAPQVSKNVAQVSNSSSTKNVAKENETLHKETHLKPKPNKKSDSSEIEAKVETKNEKLKSNLHKEKVKSEEHSEAPKAKIEHTSHVHNAELHKNITKKEPIRVSKVTHLAKKRLHNKYVKAHVTHPHVVENHSKVVHKMPVSKGTVCHAISEITSFVFKQVKRLLLIQRRLLSEKLIIL